MFEFVDDSMMNTREFAFYVFVVGVTIIYSFYLISEYGLGSNWSFVMGIAYATGMLYLSGRLKDHSEERIGGADAQD